MKLYTTPKGRWAGTQADAKAIGKEDGGWSEAEVPTDKPGLLVFLNSHSVGWDIGARLSEAEARLKTEVHQKIFDIPLGADAVEEEAHLRATAQQIADANPNSGLAKAQAFGRAVSFEIAVEEHIQNAAYPRLATLAGNVAYRFAELANEAAFKPVPAIFDAPEAEQEDGDDDPLFD